MNYHTIIGNATDDGKMSPNGKFYEVTIADSPPPGPEGKKTEKPRYSVQYVRCSLFIDEEKGQKAPTVKKGQRMFARGWLGRRDWEDKGKKGVELEMKCDHLGPMDGKLADIIEEGSKGGKAAPKEKGEEKAKGKKGAAAPF